MDVSVNPVLESVRPFFQGLPANNTGGVIASAPVTSSNVAGNLPSHPAVATPVQPAQHGVPSSSPSVLSYWPVQRAKESPSPALASPLHHVYNGTKLGEPLQSAHHNLPPIAALSTGYQQSHRAAPRPLQHHPPLPSVNQISPHSSAKTSTSSVSPRSTQAQFRAPDYPQSNHHSIYSPNSSSQSHSRSSSSSSYPAQVLAPNYQPSPGSPAVSSPSPHPYSYSPRTSLPVSSATTASSPAYPHTTSASSVYVTSSHHHRQQMHHQPQQNRPPSNQQHQSHHAMSPVIQQPSQPELHGHQQQYPSQQQPHIQHSSSQQPQPQSQRSSSHNQPQHLQHQPAYPQQHQQHHHSSSQQHPSQQTHQYQVQQRVPSYQQPQHKPTSRHNQQQQQQQHLSVQQMMHQQNHQAFVAQQQLKHEKPHHSQSRQQQQQQQPQSRSQPGGSQQLLDQQQQHNQQLLSQQHQQLQQQAALYNQSVQQTRPQSDAEKLAEMQQTLRLKQRQLAAVQAQQAYYAAASSSNSGRPSQTTTTVEASNHQRTTTTHALAGGLKRESPLDLSVKTVRQSADSTAKDDAEGLYLANYQTHEAFQHRSKLPIKTSPRNSAILPPLQLPSTVVYPHFENHPANQTASSGAPKVDFLPNFNAHQSSTVGSPANFQDLNKRQRKSSTPQLPSPSQYPPQVGGLPHMGSFKKSLPSVPYEDPNKQSQYYPASGPPSIQRSTPSNHTSVVNMQPAFAVAPSNQYSYDPLKRGSSARYDYLERRTSTSSMQSTSSGESNYSLGKRQSSSDLRHPLPPKIPRGVDTWRQTIDQQIEQRLNSYASSRGHQVNGTTKESNLNNSSMSHQQPLSPYSSASSLNTQTSQSAANLPNRPTLYSSHRSDSMSKLNLSSQQYYQHTQPQYPSPNVPPRSNQETYNNLAQVKLPSLPSNGAADKRVLSILRKRLDNREANNQMVQQQLQQQSQAVHQQERSKLYSSLGQRPYPQQLVVPSPVVSSQNKTPLQPPLGRHNLPPFNALNLERSAYASQKLHMPKAMDSVSHEYSQSNLPLRADIVPKSPLHSRTEASSKPVGGENNADFDGLAAFLAARIRTKAELKQVGPPSMEQPQQQTPTPAAGSNSSAHSPRTTPGIFSPPPSSQIHYPAVPADFGKGTPTSESDRASSSGCSSSPLKPSRDRYGINSPRRRLFGRPEDEPGVSEGVIQAREVGLRSSSETSVFDFRESDSDGETASEHQSLHEMRKDRDRRLQEKHLTVPSASSPDITTEIPEIADSEPIDDSFWSGMCDQFVNQLEKGGNKVRKRGRRKKWIHPPVDSVPSETIYQYHEVKCEPSSPQPSTSSSIPSSMSILPSTSSNLPSLSSPVSVISSVVPEIENMKLDVSESDVEAKVCKPIEEVKVVPEEESIIPSKAIKKEEESSDEDLPLSLRQTELKKIKSSPKSIKTENITSELKIVVERTVICDKPRISVDNVKKEDSKIEPVKQVVKKEVTDSEPESSADESIESVAKRLRMRKPKEEAPDNKRKTRSSEKENANTPTKGGRKKKEEKKKSVYGDGSEFKPGWEAEVYKYKRSLRMPARLINIAGPQSWPRLSVSLPDLDPDSPMTLDSEISLQNKKFESDGESTPTKTKPTDSPKTKSFKKKVVERTEEDSFINRLIQRYGGKGKKSLRKGQEKDSSKERKGPKIIPQTTELQLLPTPSLDCIVKSPNKKLDQSCSENKQVKGKKSNKCGEKPVDYEGPEAVYLGYFRKKTVTDFRDAFAKHNGGFATEHELPPIMLKSRTRTQTRILTQRATIREVFGEDRPASAPPAGCRHEEREINDKTVSNDKKPKKTKKKLLKKRNSNAGMSVGTRSGLRSAVLRSNKAVLKSKQQLLRRGARRKRSKDLMKVYSKGKKYQEDPKGKNIAPSEASTDPKSQQPPAEDEAPVLVSEKRLKYRSVRRKLKSSGFDYIRKKKKQQQKKDGETESLKDKKKASPPKANLESEEDIQNEIKGWVINKGLGETVLHRAARLGYTDIAAYCLEKMDHPPSPRDNAGYTPLHEACSKGRLDIARLLLLYGADVSDSAHGGIRPLHEAAESGCLELVRLLLSYGADPLLATYSGLTPVALTHHHPAARQLLEHHLADVQGLKAPAWQFQLTDPLLLGCDPLADAPSPVPCSCEVEVESAELSLPHLYQLLGEPHTERWVLFQELGPVLRVKTREALIRQLGPAHRNDFRDLKMTDFYDMAHCCTIMGVGDYILNPKAHKVTLVKYSDRVRALLNSETVMITAR